jgi:hypothetical protein
MKFFNKRDGMCIGQRSFDLYVIFVTTLWQIKYSESNICRKDRDNRRTLKS